MAVYFGEKIKAARKAAKLTQKQLANKVGVAHTTISNWEKNSNRPDPDQIELLCGALNISPASLWGSTDTIDIPSGFIPVPQMQRVPIVGEIACGDPITAEENIEGYAETPADRQMDFALICKGDSMIDAGIKDGDIVYIRKQLQVENGQIAAVRIDNEATLKRVYFHGDTLILQPANANYPPLSFSGAELENVVIEGLAVGFTHWM